MAVSDWSWLPPELFSAIFDRLPLVDRVHCRCVCTSWGLAARKKPTRRPPQESPWLMFSDPKKGCNFYSVSDNKSYHMDMDLLPNPDIRKRTWIGSSQGWLITVDERSELDLLNPITGVQIPLPSILSLPSITAVRNSKGQLTSYRMCFKPDPEQWNKQFKHKLSMRKTRDFLFCNSSAVVSWYDCSSTSWAVMLVFMPCQQLAYARAGDEVWTMVDRGRGYYDLLLHDGLFYTVDSYSQVKIWDLTGSTHPTPVRTISAGFSSANHLCHFYSYLAMLPTSTGKQLLMVRRGRETVLGEDMYRTLCFEVYRLDNDDDNAEPRWVRVHSLGDQALFIGINSSISLSAQDFPKLRGNCIYFADDIWERALDTRGKNRDIGVYSLEDKIMEPCYPEDIPKGIMNPCYPEDIPKLNWPPPVWITPSLL